MVTTRVLGGDIHRKDIFNRIKSIGYELETTRLAKLTLLPANGPNPDTLMHTDLNANDLAMISSLDEDDILTKERMTLPAMAGDDFSFVVTNDMAETDFTRHLQKMCEEPLEAAVAIEIADLDDEEEEEKEARIAMVTEDYKNSLYTFHPNAGGVYPIRFIYKDPRHCGLFSDVEWVGTFLTPAKSKNIILDTFFQLLRRLFQHLDELEPIPGTLKVNFSDEDKEVVQHPKTRILFRSPGTSLHYLQTHYREGEMNDSNDVLLKPQMTFSCPVVYLIDVLVEMVRPASEGTHVSDILKHLVSFVGVMKSAVQELCAAETLPGLPDFTPLKGKTLAAFQGYLWLFLFKVFRYYGYAGKGDNQAAYFKNTLFFNSRHGNAQLYHAMKALLAKHMGRAEDDLQTIETLQKIILNPAVLNRILSEIPQPKQRKGMFLFTDEEYDLKKDHHRYGDPSFSLKSYLQFFEDPKDDSDPDVTYTDDMKFKMRDWLYYSKNDVFSTQMEIVDGLVLVEVRCFLELIVDAFSGVLFPGGNAVKVPSLTIGQLKQCAADYKSKSKSKSKSRFRPRPVSAAIKGGRPRRRTRKIYTPKN
jgi:hypothetical protein